MDRRLKLEHKLSADPRLLNGALLDYAQDPCAFIGDCVFLAEPRHANTGEPTMLPCVLFPRQREFIEWLHERFTTKTSAPVEKSRDSGATWMSCAFAVWVWLFHPGSTVGFGSRKEILVDRAGDLQSIFEKIRSIVRNLPHYLKPRGFKEHTHSNYMRLLNPANDATIIGEAGDNIGRGGVSFSRLRLASGIDAHDRNPAHGAMRALCELPRGGGLYFLLAVTQGTAGEA